MGFVLADRVKDTTTTTGTGTITITGTPPTGFQGFSPEYATGDSFTYCIEDTTNGAWEVGMGTLLSSTTIGRETVLRSSNSDGLVNFGAGTKTVFVTLPADTVDTHGVTYAMASGNITL
jgi:hypothetical protein